MKPCIDVIICKFFNFKLCSVQCKLCNDFDSSEFDVFVLVFWVNCGWPWFGSSWFCRWVFVTSSYSLFNLFNFEWHWKQLQQHTFTCWYMLTTKDLNFRRWPTPGFNCIVLWICLQDVMHYAMVKWLVKL